MASPGELVAKFIALSAQPTDPQCEKLVAIHGLNELFLAQSTYEDAYKLASKFYSEDLLAGLIAYLSVPEPLSFLALDLALSLAIYRPARIMLVSREMVPALAVIFASQAPTHREHVTRGLRLLASLCQERAAAEECGACGVAGLLLPLFTAENEASLNDILTILCAMMDCTGSRESVDYPRWYQILKDSRTWSITADLRKRISKTRGEVLVWNDFYAARDGGEALQ